jgi:hypothetical protein
MTLILQLAGNVWNSREFMSESSVFAESLKFWLALSNNIQREEA